MLLTDTKVEKTAVSEGLNLTTPNCSYIIIYIIIFILSFPISPVNFMKTIFVLFRNVTNKLEFKTKKWRTNCCVGEV